MISTNIALEIFGIIITVMLLICCLFDKTARNKSTKYFISMLAINAAVLFCDLITWMFHSASDLVPILHIVNSFVYALGYVLTAVFTFYLTNHVKCSKKIAKTVNYTVTVLCTVAVLLVVISYFNGMFFHYPDGEYERGPYYWVSQAYPICILIFDMIFILCSAKNLSTREILSFLSYGILPAIAMLIQINVFGITLLYIATTLSLMIIYITVYLEQSRRLQIQEVELQQARISIMLSQIQPHFLFNSLSSIAELCGDNSTAEEALIQFSKFLRSNIDSLKQTAPLPFETELYHIKTYLYLEKLRFHEKLNIVYHLRTVDFMVPSLTVQPIVENAVKYGVCQSENGGTVEISTWEEPNEFIVEVKDDGVGFDPNETQYDGRTHIGIDNVKSRLSIMCHGTLDVIGIKNVGTTVTIRIPKEVKKLENTRG